MKALHRADLWGWSRFDEARNIDFNSVFWTTGSVVIDPLELSAHDERHVRELGWPKTVIITNSEHRRAVAKFSDARVRGPAAESFENALKDGDEALPGLRVVELHGSKTPGELALVLEETTLITGDLIRGQRGGKLNLLPDAKLKDKAKALASIRKLLDEHPRIDAVLVGDGWPVFSGGHARLAELLG